MVIQCPSCSTKFSISAEQLQAAGNPTFHCSKCGHYFRVDESEPKEPIAEPTPEDTSRFKAFETEKEETSKSSLASKQLDFLSSMDSGKRPAEASPTGNDDSDDFGGITVDWPDATTARTSEVDLSPHTKRSFLTTKDRDDAIEDKDLSVADFRSSMFEPPSSFEAGTISKDEEEEDDAVFSDDEGFTGFESRENFSLQSPERQISDFSDLRSHLKEEKTTPAKSSEPTGDEFGTEQDVQKKRERVAPSSDFILGDEFEASLEPEEQGVVHGSIGLVVVLIVPLLLSLSIWHLSADLKNVPQTVKSIFRLESTSSIVVPPAGLELVGLRPELMVLNDGNSVLEVTGNVLNTTLKNFSELDIEAQLFAADNRPITSVVAKANNALVTAPNVTSLTVDTIEEMQRRRALAELSYAPKSSQPFRIVFTEVPKEAAWLSVRVYRAHKEI